MDFAAANSRIAGRGAGGGVITVVMPMFAAGGAGAGDVHIFQISDGGIAASTTIDADRTVHVVGCAVWFSSVPRRSSADEIWLNGLYYTPFENIVKRLKQC